MIRKDLPVIISLILILVNCQPPKNGRSESASGVIEILDESAVTIIDPEASLEILAEGFEWSEGPVWVDEGQFLLFSDIPPNKIFRWSEQEGLSEYLHPSGFTGKPGRGGEPGSNGLLIDSDGKLVLCQHGDRRIAFMDSRLDDPKPFFVTMADRYDGMRLNSPNDAVFDSKGNLYLTDPPYGLEQGMEDPTKEIAFQGVYLLRKDGDLVLLTNEMSRPNGIGLSPDEKTLYVANSDGAQARWMRFDVQQDGTIANGSVFYDATELVGKPGEQGGPDGLKVRQDGIVFATGPGGVWVFSPKGVPLAKIRTGQRTSNCALSPDGKSLYMTADMFLMRISLK